MSSIYQIAAGEQASRASFNIALSSIRTALIVFLIVIAPAFLVWQSWRLSPFQKRYRGAFLYSWYFTNNPGFRKESSYRVPQALNPKRISGGKYFVTEVSITTEKGDKTVIARNQLCLVNPTNFAFRDGKPCYDVQLSISDQGAYHFYKELVFHGSVEDYCGDFLMKAGVVYVAILVICFAILRRTGKRKLDSKFHRGQKRITPGELDRMVRRRKETGYIFVEYEPEPDTVSVFQKVLHMLKYSLRTRPTAPSEREQQK